jgi:hypothetical protein
MHPTYQTKWAYVGTKVDECKALPHVPQRVAQRLNPQPRAWQILPATSSTRI